MYYSIQIILDSSTNYLRPGWDGTNFEDKFNDGWNTWGAWHLIPSSRPLVVPPSAKTVYVDIPGGDGTIDLTEITTGHTMFNDREGSWEFYVIRDYPGYTSWINVYTSIMNNIHGKKVKVVLEDDPDYYYVGRIMVNQWQSEKDWSKITLDYKLEPYKIYFENNSVKLL